MSIRAWGLKILRACIITQEQGVQTCTGIKLSGCKPQFNKNIQMCIEICLFNISFIAVVRMEHRSGRDIFMEQLDQKKLDMAIIYLQRIADGNNPVNNVPAEEDSVLNYPNVIRCMYFVKELPV